MDHWINLRRISHDQNLHGKIKKNTEVRIQGREIPEEIIKGFCEKKIRLQYLTKLPNKIPKTTSWDIFRWITRKALLVYFLGISRKKKTEKTPKRSLKEPIENFYKETWENILMIFFINIRRSAERTFGKKKSERNAKFLKESLEDLIQELPVGRVVRSVNRIRQTLLVF